MALCSLTKPLSVNNGYWNYIATSLVYFSQCVYMYGSNFDGTQVYKKIVILLHKKATTD